MPSNKPPRVALVWSQFAACHVDRCIALARRLEGRAEVLAVEVATTSSDYAAFPPSGATGAALKRTLFPGLSFDEVPRWRRFWACLAALSGCRIVYIGVPYGEVEFILLGWALRLLGKRVVLMCDSKFDDSLRASGFELAKRLGLGCYGAVLVAGSRGHDYFRFLGFRKRPALSGCDTVSIERIRAEAAAAQAPTPGFAERDFVFVGRFVEKKNLSLLIDAFARYRELEPGPARRLVLVGDGPLGERLQREAAAKTPEGSVVFAGFLHGPALARQLGSGLGLVLVSSSEQWGLVVNEALALGLPVITTRAPGSRDVLVRNLINGFVLENGAVEGIARAMRRLGSDESEWERMRAASLALAPLGDVAEFCDVAEQLFSRWAEPGTVSDRMQGQ
jgi:L-malate glycosyltransferase